jgi:amino acid transporter
MNRTSIVFSMVFMGVMSIIGSGWLFTPYFLARIAGESSICIWLVGAVLTYIIAYSLVEVLNHFNQKNVSANSILNPLLPTYGSFIVLFFSLINWLGLISYPIIEVQGALQYLSFNFPSLIKSGQIGVSFTVLGYVVGIFLFLAIVYFNKHKTWLDKTAPVSAFIKIVGPVLVALYIYTHVSYKHTHNVSVSTFVPSNLSILMKGILSGGVIFAFAGFQNIIFLYNKPEHKHYLRLGLGATILTVCALYMLLQTLFLFFIPTPVQWSDFVIENTQSPLFGLLSLLGIGFLIKYLYINAVFDPLATGVVYNQAANNQLHFILMKLRVNTKLSVWFTVVASVIICLVSPNWHTTVDILSSFCLYTFLVAPLYLLTVGKHGIGLLSFLVISESLVFSGYQVLGCIAVILIALVLLFMILGRSRAIPYFYIAVLIGYSVSLACISWLKDSIPSWQHGLAVLLCIFTTYILCYCKHKNTILLSKKTWKA